jgi:hypothetical protein
VARITESQLKGLFPNQEGLCFEAAITVADGLVDDITAGGTLSNDRAALVCLYLAGHFLQITLQDGPLAAVTVGEATERYHNVYSSGLKTTIYGQQALMLDSTGYLAKMTTLAEKPTLKSAEFRVI